jgi:predicted Zn-dependent protease
MNLKTLLSSVDIKVDWIGLRKVEEKTTVRRARNGNLDPLAISYDKGIMVEILMDGQFSYAGTNDLSAEGVQKAAERALSQSKRLRDYRLFSFESAVRPCSTGTYKTPIKYILESSKAHSLNELALHISKSLRVDDKIINTSAAMISIEQEMSFISSNGSDFIQHFHQRAFHCSATAREGSNIQTRTNGFPLGQGGDEFFDADCLSREASRIAREAIELTQAEECPAGLYDLVLMPDQLYLQIHESIGHPLELDRILGDERNYAGWSFIKPEDFGHLQYGSPLLNVTFDPFVQGEFASYQYDDTGATAEQHYLIKEGVLQRGLGSLESQKRSGIPGVSSARASSWNRPPIDRMANINIEHGSSTLAEMISSTENGILMKTNKSWSIDDYRNKFQFGCEYGQLIENGKITKTLKNPNYRGVTTPFWHGLKMVGDASTFEIHGNLYCGKGEPNQIIRVGHATPVCLFTGVEVFGGGAQ